MKYRLDVSPNVHHEVARIYLYREKHQGKGSGNRFQPLSDCYKDIRTPTAIRCGRTPIGMRCYSD